MNVPEPIILPGETETSREAIVEAVCTRGVEFARGILFASIHPDVTGGFLTMCSLTRDFVHDLVYRAWIVGWVPELSDRTIKQSHEQS